MMNKLFYGLLVILSFTACKQDAKKEAAVEAKDEAPIFITEKVDNAVKQLDEGISSFMVVTALDHHRMAADAGVYTPPSIATIFSNTQVNIALVQENQLVGLDLPFKVLCYAEADTLDAKVAFTSAEFIAKRHQLDEGLLTDYSDNMTKVLQAFPAEMISKTDVSAVGEGFGIVSIQSDFDYQTTVKNLKDIVMSQSDTKWFADVDYQKEASEIDVDLRPTTLLLFGGPAPGGKAMMTSPKIGLDAFCQKLLVYEDADGLVWVAFNDIVAFAKLYYGITTKPQQMINQRLIATFSKAVKKED